MTYTSPKVMNDDTLAGSIHFDRASYGAILENTCENERTISVDVELCRLWGMLRAEQQAAGRTIASQDAWIAATALRHHLPLITHNPSDFQSIANLDVRSIIEH